MATYSSILAWRIPGTEEPGRLQLMGLQRVGHDLATNSNTFKETATSSLAFLFYFFHYTNGPFKLKIMTLQL